MGCTRNSNPDAKYLCNICASKVPDAKIVEISAAIDAGNKPLAQDLINALLAYLRTV